MIRLSEIDPVQLARDVCELVTNHVRKITFHLDAGRPPWPEHLEHTELGLSVTELAGYAQIGPPHCDDAGGPAEYLQTVIEALYQGAHPDVYRRVDVADMAGRAEPEHGIDVVIRAAIARDLIGRGDRVPIAWLACLASLPVQTLRTYGSRGEIVIQDGDVTAKRAREWLSGRGVAGFA